MMFQGDCPECSGRVEKSLEICPDHGPGDEEPCGSCGRDERVFGSITCTVCKRWSAGSLGPKSCAFSHPAVVAFTYDPELDGPSTDDTDHPTLRRRCDLLEQFEQHVESLDPPMLRFTLSYDGDELELVMDETMTIVEVDGW